MRASSPKQLARPHRAASQNLQCNFCGIIFIKVEHLQRHQRRHTGERPYPCLTCGKRFSRRDVLSRHKQIHVPKENAIQSISSCSHAREPGTVTITEDGDGALMVPLKAPASHPSCHPELPANGGDPEMCVNEPWISATLGDFPFEDLPSPVEVNEKDKSGDARTDLFEQLDFVLSGDGVSLHNGYYIDGFTVGPEHQPDFGLTEPSANHYQPPETTHLHNLVSVSEVESLCDQNSCSPRSQLSVFTFDRIQAIWGKTRVHTTAPAGTLWQAVLDHPEENIISMINSHSDVLQKPSNRAGIRHGLFYRNDIKDEVVAPLPPNAPCERKWSRRCRVECIRRLINCLFMMDALYSSILETPPLIPPNKAAFNLPSSPKLFNATSVLEWKRNLDRELPGLAQPGSNIRTVPINLPETDGPVCDFGVQALLFAIWMHVAEGTQRLVYGSQLGERVSTIVPATMLSKDIDITYASQVLVLISQGDSTLLSALNPNSQILWHSLCIMLTVNVQTLEDGAGRRGSQRESTALKEIKTWAATPAARRACLHAAQIYYILSNGTLAHHTMIHSETGLFHAALAISLYIWAMPRSTEDQAISDDSDDKALELLDSFDWVPMGREGFIQADEKSCPLPDDATSGRLVDFVRHGGQLSFSGLCLRGGRQCARRVLLDYNVLLQRVSRYLDSGFHEILDFLGERLME
ncbi:hypothetical protein NUW58_g5751 [Xylaria curta]|uniref:Uncharacterized protein n=1 Tax=Xylaria curta TaxID=42375 RepID=A0ACC1P1E7_9PEZI|nr:hypothetical protein NUW58_g5751 [Xylaria curta]